MALFAGCTSGTDTGSADGDKPTLTLVTWGGTTQDGFKSAAFDPFTEETGIPTKLVNPVDYGKYTAQIENDQVNWDWVDLEGWYILQNPDFWAPVDTDIVKYDESDVIQLPGATEATGDWAVPGGSYSFTISYRTDVEGDHPTTWAEFFDPEAIPGKRGVYNWPYGMLEVALLGDGVAFEELYPLDIDRAIAKLDSVRDSLVFWNSGAELQQIMSTGETPFSFAWNNRIENLQKGGQPVANEWNENLQDGGYNVTAKNGPNVEETMQLFNYMMRPEVDAEVAMATGYSPSFHSAMDLIPADQQPQFSAYEPNMEQAVGTINLQWWAENFDEATTKWYDWVGQ